MGTEAAPDQVLPWDRRVRVFVSSTLEELAAERAAVREAIARLRLTPVMFELGARSHPPRELYVSYLQQSDVFVGIYGDRYGWIAPGSAISGLEDEYLLAAGHPKLLYIKTPAPAREPRLTELIERIWNGSGASTAPYRDAADLGERVAEDLAVLLTERFHAERRTPGLLDPLPVPHPATPLVGRQADVDRVAALLLGDVRLVTVLGPGGIGKTRLALAVAERLRPSVEAVCFVDLAPVRDADAVLPAVASALRVHPAARPPGDVLKDVLDEHRVLLVLDNMEHLLAAAPQVADLLAACGELRILVTSRAVLRLHGEHELPLAPLPVPDTGSTSAAEVAAAPAAQLFVQQAEQVRPGFAVTVDNAGQIAAVVRRLEGIPLALELAAARLRLLPLSQLLSSGGELDLTSRDVDTPDRQRTLRSTIAWSYGLLDAPDQALLGCLSVFVAGWTLPAAEAVAGPNALDGLSRLVDHSLVSVDLDGPGEPRFRMLQAVRAFMLERLKESDGYADTMSRLAGYVARLAEEAEAGLRTGASRAWRSRLDAELDTIRAVLDWAVESDDAALAVRVAAPLTRYLWSRGLLVEMLGLADRVASLESASRLEAQAAGILLWCRGTIRLSVGDHDEARDLLHRVVDDARAREDELLLAQALFSAALLTTEDDGTGPRPLLEESSRLFARNGDQWGHALALVPLGELELLAGRPELAEAAHTEALAAAQAVDDDHMRATVLDQLAADALLRGDSERAAELLCQSAAIHLSMRDSDGIANCLDAFCALALFQGRPPQAARYLAAAERVRAVAGVVVWPFLQPLRDQLEAAVTAAVPSSDLERERATSAFQDGLAALDEARRDVVR